MGYDYESTHNKIKESAVRHFGKEGFRKASIRQICKDAGVTNGAFYSHFDSKEDLFAGLVEPIIKGFDSLYSEENKRYKTIKSKKDIIPVFGQVFASDRLFVDYVYQNAEIFRLLLTSAGGSAYEGFVSDLIKDEKESTMAVFELCRPFLENPENMSENIASQISSIVVTTVFNCFLGGLSKDETVRQTELAAEFCLGGLKSLWGI